MKAINKNLTPQLRFPEFKNSSEWEEKKLGELTLDINERNNSNLTKVLSVTNAYGIVEQEDFFQKIVASEDLSNYKVIRKGDIAYNPSRINVGSVDILNKYKLGIMSPMYVIVRCKENILDNFFLKQWLISGTFYLLLEKYLQGGVRKSLPYNLFKNIDILIPSFKEQQKIAYFLSSVDELIIEQVKKLEKLKEYKKGLLQNLFPKENQKVPDLRFSEFKNSGEWEEKKLDDISYYIASNYSASSALEQGKYCLYDANKIIGFVNAYLCDRDYISIIKDGSGVGRTRFMKAYSNFIGTMGGIVPNDDINSYFLYSLVNNINFKQYIKGATIPHIYYTDYSEHIVYITCTEEQKKIADFLASVDELIIEQIKKIEIMQEYKKGLLQKLFL